MSSQRVYEGWMVRYGRRKIGTSFIHMRYFVLGPRLLCYYKKMPDDSQVPIKTMVIDGNCRVEDRGLKTQQGHMVYVFCVYSKKEKHHRITMAAFNIHEALIWKEKIELVIDQHQGSQVLNENKYVTFGYTSDTESQFSPHEDEEDEEDEEDKDEPRPNFSQQTIIRNGPLESLFGWTQESDSELSKRNTDNQAVSGKHWRLVQCHNGLRIFEELVEVNHLPGSCSRARKAVGIVKATCEEIFELIMSMDGTRFEWDCSFQYGSLVEEVDGHTAIFYQRLQLDWYPMFVWPRDLCYVRYWRRNDDGSYVVLFQSREHENCGPQPGYVRAHIESGGFNISPLTPRNGRPRTQVQHLMQIDLKGWGVGYISSFQQHCLLQMLTSVAGLREWFAQTNKRNAAPRIPEKGLREWFAQTNKRNAAPRIPEKREKLHVSLDPGEPTDQVNAENRNSVMMEEFSDEDEEFEIAEAEQEADTSGLESNIKRTALEEEPVDEIDLSCFSGNLWCDDRDNAHNCWRILDGNNYRVRSKHFCSDKTKIPAGKHLMHLVAVDWFKDTKRIDHVVRRQGCAAQVALEKGLFSLIINFQELVLGSLLQRFVDGDDEFRNSRLKLIPSVPKGSWIVRQSVGSAPCSLGKVVDCNYIRGPKYLEIDVDIGSSAVANGVLGIVFGESTKLVVDMAILIQANTTDELPERLIGAVRVSHIDLSTAVAPELD